LNINFFKDFGSKGMSTGGSDGPVNKFIGSGNQFLFRTFKIPLLLIFRPQGLIQHRPRMPKFSLANRVPAQQLTRNPMGEGMAMETMEEEEAE
jgi:hypothetical protein